MNSSFTEHSDTRNIKRYDSKLVEVARQRLTIVEDLRAAGLVVPMSFGTTETAWERVSDVIEAEVNMDGQHCRLPKTALPMTKKVSADSCVHAELVTGYASNRSIAHHWQSTSDGNYVGGGTVGCSPHRISCVQWYCGVHLQRQAGIWLDELPTTATRLPSRVAWTAAGGATIKADTINLLKAAYADNMHGPFNLYVANDIYANIQDDFSTEKGDRTHAERIMAFNDISAVKAADKLPSGNVVLVQMTDSVIDLAVGQDIANVQWNVDPMSTEYMVYAAMAPRIKSDREGRCGIVHGTV